jgi:hypothetical protein
MPELMVTVAIVGILAALSIGIVRTDTVGDRTRAVAALLQEAHRKAVAGGPIRADVSAAGFKARTQVAFSADRAELWQLVEDSGAGSAHWSAVSTVMLPPGSHQPIIWAVLGNAQTDAPGTIPTKLSAPVEKYCYPGGTCDALTVYLARDDASSITDGDHFRVTVFPVSGIASTMKGW